MTTYQYLYTISLFPDTSVELSRVVPDFNLQPWHSCHRLIYVRPNPKTGVPIGHWPIPESFWPDQNTPTLVSWQAHLKSLYTVVFSDLQAGSAQVLITILSGMAQFYSLDQTLELNVWKCLPALSHLVLPIPSYDSPAWTVNQWWSRSFPSTSTNWSRPHWPSLFWRGSLHTVAGR